MTTTNRAAARGAVVELPPPGLLGSLIGRFKPRPLSYQYVSKGVRVNMPGKKFKFSLVQRLLQFVLAPVMPDLGETALTATEQAELGRFSRFLYHLRTVPAKGYHPWFYTVYDPEVFWAAATFGGKVRKIGQVIYKSVTGYASNLLFYGVFGAVYYFSTQNGWVVHDWNTLLVPMLGVAGWEWLRHLVVRDTGEYLYRYIGAWLAFDNALSPRRQHGREGAFVRAMEKTKVVPSDEEGDGDVGWFRRTIQVLLSFFTVYIAAIPGLALFFGAIGIIGLFDSALYNQLMPKAPAYAAIFGAYFFGKMVFARIAILFQGTLINIFDDHNLKMRAWMLIPSHIRAYQNSGRAPASRPGRHFLRGPILVFGVVAIIVAARVGYWIYANKDGYLQTHYLTQRVPFDYMVHSIQTSFVHWVETLPQQFTHLYDRVHHLLHRAHLAP